MQAERSLCVPPIFNKTPSSSELTRPARNPRSHTKSETLLHTRTQYIKKSAKISLKIKPLLTHLISAFIYKNALMNRFCIDYMRDGSGSRVTAARDLIPRLFSLFLLCFRNKNKRTL